MSWELFKLTRPVMCLFSGASVLLGAKLSQGHWTFANPVVFATLATICFTALAMVWDGLWDTIRGGPVKGQYHFVVNHKVAVAWLAFGLLAVAGICINGFSEITFWQSPAITVDAVSAMVVIAAVALAYPFVLDRIPGLPNLLVASLSALTIVVGALVAGGTKPVVWLVALLILFILLAREIAKDFEDVEIDPGFKVTLPLWNDQAARLIMTALCVFSALTIWWLCRYLSEVIWHAAAVAANICLAEAVRETFAKGKSQSKNWLTLAMFLLVLGVALA